MIKRISCILIIVLMFICLLPLNVFAAEQDDDYYQPYYDLMESKKSQMYTDQLDDTTVYMHDLADEFSPSDEARIINAIFKASEGANINVLILVQNNFLGTNEQIFSDNYMDILFPNSENNLGIILNAEERIVYINTMGVFYRTLNEEEIQKCIDSGYYSLKFNNYAKGVKKIAAYTVEYSLNEEKGISNLTFRDYLTTENMIIVTVISILLTAIFISSLMYTHKKSMTTVNAQIYSALSGGMKVHSKRDEFVTTRTTVSHGYYKSSSGSSSSSRTGGGGGHRSSGGRTHGGGGRRF